MRRLVPLVVMTTALSGCAASNLGRTTPECLEQGVTTATVLEVQALPDARYVPCVESLPVGWEYNHLHARSGLVDFTLDSDRMGDAFVEVRATESCDVGGATEQPAPLEAMRLYTDVVADLTVPMVFVPEGPTDETIDAAQAIVTGLVGEYIAGKRIDVVIDRTQGATADRIEKARAGGANVFVIGLREAEEGTVTVLLASRADEVTTTIERALEMIERSESPASYTGSWFYVFDGGCIEYRFDASGPETHEIERRIRESLGFTDAEEVRGMARSLGFDI